MNHITYGPYFIVKYYMKYTYIFMLFVSNEENETTTRGPRVIKATKSYLDHSLYSNLV